MSYRTLQAQVRSLRNGGANTPKLNSTKAVLEAYLANPSAYVPTPGTAPKTKKAPFDWQGCATNRRDAVATLKVYRNLGHTVPKLNSTNVVLLQALESFANDTPNNTAPTPTIENPMPKSTPATETPITAPTEPTPPLGTDGKPDRDDPTYRKQMSAWAKQMAAIKGTTRGTLEMQPIYKNGQIAGHKHRFNTNNPDGSVTLGTWY